MLTIWRSLMKIAVCDDDLYFRNYLSKKAADFFDSRVIKVDIVKFSSAKSMLDSDNIADFDIVFLDVSMPEIDGIEAGRVIAKKSPKTIIIYVSGLIEHAPASLEIDNTMRYLLKSQLNEKFYECMQAAVQRLNYDNTQISIHFTDGEIRVFRYDITFIESRGHLLTFHFSDAKKDSYTSRKYTLKSVQQILGEDIFLRVDQSYLVNMMHIDQLRSSPHGYTCILNSGKEIIVSQRKYRSARRSFFLYKGKL